MSRGRGHMNMNQRYPPNSPQLYQQQFMSNSGQPFPPNSGQQFAPNTGQQFPPAQTYSTGPSHSMADINFGLKSMGLGNYDPGNAQFTAGMRGPMNEQDLQNNSMLMHNVYHPTDTNRAPDRPNGLPSAPQKQQTMSGVDFLNSLGFTNLPIQVGPPKEAYPQGILHPVTVPTLPPQHSLATAVPRPSLPQAMPHNVIPHHGPSLAHALAETSLSVAANEFVPGFRKPEKDIILYTTANFRKKSKANDEMAINDVKKKLIQLFNSPQDVDTVMESAVDTIKSWTTSVNTYHQIVEDVFEFSVDESSHANFHPIGSKVLNYLTLKVPPYNGNPPLTFFDTVVHKCCREFDNCMRLDHREPPSQDRVKNVALMISDLFHTIKEGELRVFLFAEQVTSLCLVLVQIKTLLAIETVAKIFLVCGKDLKTLVDDMRFNCIMQHLSASTKLQLDRKTRAMVENVLRLNEGGWQVKEEPITEHKKSWSGGDDCQPVTNPGEWDDYATDDYDDEWLTEMLRFEEEDDFSDVEEDFKKFMEEAAQKYKN